MLRVRGGLLSLFFILLLGISEIKIAGVLASLVGESVDRQAKILILWFMFINWSILSWVLYYHLTSKGFTTNSLQTHEIIGYSATPLIIYNFFVFYLEKELASVYIPVDPFGIASLIFLNKFSLEFVALHLLLWISVISIYTATLKRALPQIKIREVFISALLVGITYVGLLMFEYSALIIYFILIFIGISTVFLFIYKIKKIRTEIRARILAHLEENGAVHFRGLAKALNIRKSTLSYHLNVLEKFGLVNSQKSGKFKVYYTDSKGGHPYINGTAKRILYYVRDKPDSTARDIAESLHISPSTVSYHLKNLEEAGLIHIDKEGREIRVKVGRRFTDLPKIEF